MKPLKILLTLFLTLTLTNDMWATHILGGEITWSCHPSGGYVFQLVIYRDCTGNPFNRTSVDLNSNSPLGTIMLPRDNSQYEVIIPNCAGTTLTCATAKDRCMPGPAEKFVFNNKNNPVSFPAGSAPPVTGWEFSFDINCRPETEYTCSLPGGRTFGGNANSTTCPYYLRAKMYPYTPPGSTTPVSADNCYDNSPVFEEEGNVVLCEGQPFTYNHLASDKELDSIRFAWADPLQGANNPIVWEPGFSTTAPFPDQTENPLNGPVTLDPVTGEISMNVVNTGTTKNKSYASCISIQAYKCGQLVAEVFRDVSIFFLKDCPQNDKPEATIDTSIYSNIIRNGNVYSTRVYPRDTVKFELSAQDLDNLTIPPYGQIVTFEANGLQMSSFPYSSGTGCGGPAPCASATPIGGGGYSKPISNDIFFEWVPDCVHLNFAACGSGTNRYYFTLKMTDDGCPAPAVALATLIVDVISGDPTPPPLKCVNYNSNGDVEISWTAPPQDSLLDFNYYVIWGASSPNGPYTQVDSIFDYNTTTTVISGQSAPAYYYIQQSTGECDFLSNPSDTLSTMLISLTAYPPGNAQYADLSWTPPTNSLASSSTQTYEIWAEAPSGSGNWLQIGQTTGLTYTDTVQICSDYVTYQIRLADTSEAMCYSASTVDSAFFSDQTNSDQINIDSISVNANGNAILSWQPSSYGDVVEYYILFNDPKTGWGIVDIIPVGTPMPYEWMDSEADTRSEEFKVISVDSCGNQSDELIAQSYNTIYLRNYLNKCEGFSNISWNDYNRFPGGVAGYNLWVQITDDNANTTSPILLQTTGPDDMSYTQSNLQNGYQYCYTVQAIDTSGILTSSSNEICVTAEVPQKSRLLYVAQVTNNVERGAVGLKAYIDGEADVLSFAFERALDFYGPYEIIGEVDKPVTAPYVINYLDFAVNPDRYRYFYRISATDSCGARDTISNTSRNMLLFAQPQANLTNALSWNPYESWAGEVVRYDIYRSEEGSGVFNLVKSNTGDDTTFVDDITDFKQTRGDFCYYVVAVEGNNPIGLVNDNGLPFTSRSNTVCLNQKAKIFIPNAFRPNSTVLQNQTFGPSLEFEDVDNYRFYILDRWGNMMFETQNPEDKWDGLHNGEPAPQGVYVYYIQYATPGDDAQEKRGSFTLVR